MTIGERLKMIRIKENLLQKEVGDKCGITAQTLSRYENDQRTPDNDFLKKFLTQYKVSSDWLLFGEPPIYRTNVDKDVKEAFLELISLLIKKEFPAADISEKFDFSQERITDDVPDNYLLLLKYMMQHPLIRKSIFQFFQLILRPLIDKNPEFAEKNP